MRKAKLQELEKMIQEFQNIKKEKILEEPEFLSIQKYKCTFQNQIFYREKVLKNKKAGNAQVILPITKNKEVVFVVQPRVFTESGVCIELPAGYQEEEEESLTTAKRELLEETGLSSKNFILLGAYYQDQGVSSAYNEAYLALGCEFKSKQKLDQDEFVKIFTCSIKEAYELIDLGYIKDINTLYVLEHAKSILKRRERK